MAAIPSLVWLFIGAIVVGISWYSDMPLFFWIGWAFIAFGIAKLIIIFVLGGKEKNEKRQAQQAAQHQHRYSHKYYRCLCGNPVRTHDIFCSYCGRRLR
ncbi:MAG: hypothetical protein QXM31_00555 [Candidatus Woesearchaeota archaeon]